MASPEPALAFETELSSRRLGRPAIEHYNPAPIRKVGLARWKTVLDRVEPATCTASVVTLDEVVRVLTTQDVSPRLQELLHALHNFGTPAGAQAIHEAGIALGIDRLDWPESVEELAVEMSARAFVNPDYERIFCFAEIAIHDRDTDLRCREFTASALGPLRAMHETSAGW